MNQSKAQIKHRLPSAGKCLLASYIWTIQNSDQTRAAKREKTLTSKLHLNQSKLRSNTGCQARENAYKKVTLDLNWLRRATSFLRQSWSKVMQNHGNLQITAFTNQFKPKLTSDIFIVTEVVVSLDAPDEFLKNRVMNLPESVVAGTHNTEEGLFQIIHDHSKKHKA